METVDLSAILSSQARYRVLRSLCRSSAPVQLRELERLTGLSIRPVQVAISALESEEIIFKSQIGRRTVFSLNESHPAAPVLRAVFETEARETLRLRARQLAPRAQAALRFSTEAMDLMRQSKR